jgi:hypothetical protein
MERFYRGLRNPLAAKPSYHKPFYLSNLSILHMEHALYTQNHGLSNLHSLKNPHKNAQKM